MSWMERSVRNVVSGLVSLRFNTKGVTALEYGVLTGLIALAITGAITLFGSDAKILFTTVANTI